MRIVDALAFLDSHENLERAPAVAGRVGGLSLDAVRRLLHVLGDPQTQYPVIHVTGTNGKGSVSRMAAELLVAHGLTVGVYSSPHLQRVNERMWWSGDPAIRTETDGAVVPAAHGRPGGAIDDDDLARVLGEVADAEAIAGIEASWFEVVTAAAFSWFAEMPVDVAVVEVGLLGRFDATNVVEAAVAVITNVGPDHTDFAPGWREAIAREKAGIIKAGSMVVLGEPDAELRPVFEDEVRAVLRSGDESTSLPLVVRDVDFEVTVDQMAVGGRLVDIRTPASSYDEVFVPLHGEHQGDNAAVALTAVEAFFGRALDVEVVREGFAAIRLAGRMEVVSRQPVVMLDGAHNPGGAQALAGALADEFALEGRLTYVLGMLRGRDVDAFLDALDVSRADTVVACTAPSPRAVPAQEIADKATARGVETRVVPDVDAAIDEARAGAQPEDVIVVTGSMYVVGAARDALGLG